MEFIETVRAIILSGDEILMLIKSPTANDPNAYEFPGGKIDIIRGSEATKNEKITALIKEVLEETNIIIYKEDVIDLKITERITFFHKNKEVGRYIHFFFIDYTNKPRPTPTIGLTVKPGGLSEDNHVGYAWVKLDDYEESLLKISGNSKIKDLKKLLSSKINSKR